MNELSHKLVYWTLIDFVLEFFASFIFSPVYSWRYLKAVQKLDFEDFSLFCEAFTHDSLVSKNFGRFENNFFGSFLIKVAN